MKSLTALVEIKKDNELKFITNEEFDQLVSSGVDFETTGRIMSVDRETKLEVTKENLHEYFTSREKIIKENKSEQVSKLVKNFLEELKNILKDNEKINFRSSQDRPIVPVETSCGETACRQTGPTTTIITIVDDTNTGKIL